MDQERKKSASAAEEKKEIRFLLGHQKALQTLSAPLFICTQALLSSAARRAHVNQGRNGTEKMVRRRGIRRKRQRPFCSQEVEERKKKEIEKSSLFFPLFSSFLFTFRGLGPDADGQGARRRRGPARARGCGLASHSGSGRRRDGKHRCFSIGSKEEARPRLLC